MDKETEIMTGIDKALNDFGYDKVTMKSMDKDETIAIQMTIITQMKKNNKRLLFMLVTMALIMVSSTIVKMIWPVGC